MKKTLLFSAALLSSLTMGKLASLNIHGEGEEIEPIVLETNKSGIEVQELSPEPIIKEEIPEDKSRIIASDEKLSQELMDDSNKDSVLEEDESINILNEEEFSTPEFSKSEENLEQNSALSTLEEIKPVSYAATGNTERINQPTLSGIDISNWQVGINIQSLEADFIICKSSGGKDYSDPQFPLFSETVLSSGKLLGYYHFARDTNHEGTAIEEATHFYNTVQNYIGRGIPVLDWEGNALSLGTSWAKSFLDTFYNLSGVKPLLYISAYVSRSYDWSDVANAGYKLWVAQYANDDPVYGHDTDPWRDNLGVGAFVEPVMHQYTSNGRIPGYNGNLDLNIFYGNSTTWKDLMKPDSTQPTFSMYRLYNPNSGEHFYTKDNNEKNHLVYLGWRDEGVGWIAPRAGEAVYRLYNPNAGDHHYTLNRAEKDMLVKVGWNYEGIGWYSDSSNGITLYRAYNPNAKAGAHHYTMDVNEYNYLVSIGWKPEGISWFGVSPSKSAATGIGSNESLNYLLNNSLENNNILMLNSTTNIDKEANYSKVLFEEIRKKTISNPISELIVSETKESLIKV